MTTHTPDLHELRGFDDDKFALADLSEPTQAYIRERNELRAQRDELLMVLQQNIARICVCFDGYQCLAHEAIANATGEQHG